MSWWIAAPLCLLAAVLFAYIFRGLWILLLWSWRRR